MKKRKYIWGILGFSSWRNGMGLRGKTHFEIWITLIKLLAIILHEIVQSFNGKMIWGVQFLRKDEHTMRFSHLNLFVVPICSRKSRRNRMPDSPSSSVSRSEITVYPDGFPSTRARVGWKGASGIRSGVHTSAAVIFFGKMLERLERYPLLWPRLSQVN